MQKEQMASEREKAPEPEQNGAAEEERKANGVKQEDIITFPDSGPVTSDAVARMLDEKQGFEEPWKCFPLTKSRKADFKIRRS
jgi:hypothetical protein